MATKDDLKSRMRENRKSGSVRGNGIPSRVKLLIRERSVELSTRQVQLRKNYFKKLIKYMKNVFHIENKIKKLRDGRVNPKYKTSQAVLPVLLGFLLRIQSLNELKFLLKENEFRNVFPKKTAQPGIDAIRDTIKVIELDGLKFILRQMIKKAIENKVFVNGTIDGYTVAAVDGSKFFGSNNKFCSECLRNNKHYFHSGAVMSIIGDGPKLTIGFEIYRPKEDSISKDEGELSVAKRLISDVSKNYKKFVDVVVYDALACNSIWINHCQNLGVNVIVRAKENNITSLKQVKKKTNKQDPVAIWENVKGFDSVKIYESTFIMDNVEQELRFVKFAMKYPDGKRSQIMII